MHFKRPEETFNNSALFPVYSSFSRFIIKKPNGIENLLVKDDTSISGNSLHSLLTFLNNKHDKFSVWTPSLQPTSTLDVKVVIAMIEIRFPKQISRIKKELSQ